MVRLTIPLALVLLVPAAQAQRAAVRPSTDGWEVTEQTNRPSLTLELSALTTLAGPVFQVRPVLLVRCQERELELFVSTGSVLESDDNLMTPVRVQWGSQAAVAASWSRSTDSTSAFAPDPRALIQQLVTNPDLRLEIHPSGKSPQLIRFNARGLERHMPEVNAACSPAKREAH